MATGGRHVRNNVARCDSGRSFARFRSRTGIGGGVAAPAVNAAARRAKRTPASRGWWAIAPIWRWIRHGPEPCEHELIPVINAVADTLRTYLAAIVSSEPDITIAGEAANGEEAIAAFRTLRPDIMLLDLQMPVLGGLEVIRAVREEFAGARIVVLTTYEGDVQALRALRAGASGYLLKTSLRKELLDAIRLALSTLFGVGTELSLGEGESDLVRAIRESAQQGTSRAGDQIVTKNLDVQPTITVRPGWPLRVVVHKDIVLAPWPDQEK